MKYPDVWGKTDFPQRPMGRQRDTRSGSASHRVLRVFAMFSPYIPHTPSFLLTSRCKSQDKRVEPADKWLHVWFSIVILVLFLLITSTRALAETVLMLVNARPQAAPALRYVQRLPSWVRSGRLASQKGCARGGDGYFLPHTCVFHLHVANILDGDGLSGRGCVYLHASSVHCFEYLSTAPAEAASVFGPLSFSFIASYLTSLFFLFFLI